MGERLPNSLRRPAGRASRVVLRAASARPDLGKIVLLLTLVSAVAGLAVAAAIALGQAEQERRAMEERALVSARSITHAADLLAAGAAARL